MFRYWSRGQAPPWLIVVFFLLAAILEVRTAYWQTNCTGISVRKFRHINRAAVEANKHQFGVTVDHDNRPYSRAVKAREFPNVRIYRCKRVSSTMHVILHDRFSSNSLLGLILPLTEAHIHDINMYWVRAFQQRYRSQKHDEDSWMWNTRATPLNAMNQRADLRSFALVAEDHVLGVLFLQNEAQPSRFEPRSDLIYVHYVATAPWNRRDNSGPGRLRGVGTSLMTCAKKASLDVGCEGRLGLHAFRSSDAFYQLLGLHSFGPDAAHRGMTYFELSNNSAAHLLLESSEAPRRIGSSRVPGSSLFSMVPTIQSD